MSERYKPTLIYQRKKHQTKSIDICTTKVSGGSKPSDGCYSAVSSKPPSVAAQEDLFSASKLAAEAVRLPIVPPLEWNTGNAEPFNGCPVEEEACSEEMSRIDVQRVLDDCYANDNYSSSKSNLGVGSSSLKTDADSVGECSSSGALVAEKLLNDMSERDVCIEILRSQGLREKDWARWNHVPDKDAYIGGDNCCSKTCEVCQHIETTLNLLICDNCEEAFHITCCKPRIKRLPVGEWLCNSCSKKRNNLLEKSTSNSVNISTQNGRNGNSASKDEFGVIDFMIRDTEPYMSNVRVGNEFQAKVPGWSGPVDSGSDFIGEPLKMDPSKNSSMQDKNSRILSKLSSVGNWLECQEIIEDIGGVNETVCGKWRRAPLFEVQTDNFECFHCVLWDPAHADCAVPQELDTEEVMKQLKYMEMLRPWISRKTCKVERSKNKASQKPLTLKRKIPECQDRARGKHEG